jgi:hypothetical protein
MGIFLALEVIIWINRCVHINMGDAFTILITLKLKLCGSLGHLSV